MERARHCETMNRSASASKSLTLASRQFSIINQPLCRLKGPFLWYGWNYGAHLEEVEDLHFFLWVGGGGVKSFVIPVAYSSISAK